MDINLELYKCFYYVATTLSFSEASRQLFISQSAVSQGIKTLEKSWDGNCFSEAPRRFPLPQREKYFSNMLNQPWKCFPRERHSFLRKTDFRGSFG
ncbi:MAG: LysR family transcriptional regulator [Ruminococcus sp.]